MAKRENPIARQRAQRVLKGENDAVSDSAVHDASLTPVAGLGAIGGAALGAPLGVAANVAIHAVGAMKAKKSLKNSEDSIAASIPKIDVAKAKNAALRQGRK